MLEEDELMMLNGVSGKTMEKLNRTGITKVKDMKYLDNHKDTILGICLETRVGDKNGVSPSLGLKLIDQQRMQKTDRLLKKNIIDSLQIHTQVNKVIFGKKSSRTLGI